MKREIAYIGTSHTILNSFFETNIFDISKVICEEKRITSLYKKAVDSYNLSLNAFTNKLDFETLINGFHPDTIFIIYQLDLIVPKSLTQKYRFFNLHSGSLKTNRGAHPIIWSILKGELETEFTLHEINEKIDQGIIVGKYPISIHENDNVLNIKNNMENGFSYLFTRLVKYLDNEIEGEICIGGKYNKPIQQKDFTIDIKNDNINTIKNKIRSQKLYKGAILIDNNIIHRINEIIDYKINNFQENDIIISDTNIEIYRNNEYIKLKKTNEVD